MLGATIFLRSGAFLQDATVLLGGGGQFLLSTRPWPGPAACLGAKAAIPCRPSYRYQPALHRAPGPRRARGAWRRWVTVGIDPDFQQPAAVLGLGRGRHRARPQRCPPSSPSGRTKLHLCGSSHRRQGGAVLVAKDPPDPEPSPISRASTSPSTGARTYVFCWSRPWPGPGSRQQMWSRYLLRRNGRTTFEGADVDALGSFRDLFLAAPEEGAADPRPVAEGWSREPPVFSGLCILRDLLRRSAADHPGEDRQTDAWARDHQPRSSPSWPASSPEGRASS